VVEQRRIAGFHLLEKAAFPDAIGGPPDADCLVVVEAFGSARGEFDGGGGGPAKAADPVIADRDDVETGQRDYLLV